MKTKRELAIKQIELQERIQASGINIVTCGNCGTILIHELKDELINCACCNEILDQCDCPDLWYRGQENNSEFADEDDETFLGNIEGGRTNLKVYATDYGYRLKFYSNDNEIGIADCLDSDHVWRELRDRSYNKSMRKVVLGML